MVLNVPAGVDVRKVDLSIELQILAFHAQRRSVVRVDTDDRGWPDEPATLPARNGVAGREVRT
jgi:redox-sensing transcriptional repressor